MELTNEFRVSVPIDEAWAVLTDVERIAPCLPGAQLQEVEGDEYRGIVKVKVGPITAQYKGKATFLEKDDAGHKAVLKADARDSRGQGNANAIITATLRPDGSGTSVTVVTDLTVTGKVAQFGRGTLAEVSAKLLTQFVDCLETDLLTAPAASEAPADSDVIVAEGPAAEAIAMYDPTAEPVAPAVPASAAATATSTATGTDTLPPISDDGLAETLGEPAPAAAIVSGRVHGEEPMASAASGPRKIESVEREAVDLLEAAGIPAAKRAVPLVAGVLVILWFLRRRRQHR
ncbi:MAG: Carbon monoxide oxidation accessory protein CoxG [uncultured Acidimicrobiales bacterium]|uniref:Carbon monoxide oxidation accessory protein CoxG n=1 Tax=uncultured Acidimicrobiales bacterium TaxID=310071 RepID=A0A6J4HI84_9ACTN|nr:MAG: Carbon monoxide oxidation accessory protein CoxG [uncultured Acidimicrobiales bacterium]